MINQLLLRSLITGIVTSLLYLSFAFIVLSPLPLFYAGLAWGLTTAIGASLVVFIVILNLVSLPVAVAFYLVFALPVLLLVYKALQFRTDETSEHFLLPF